MMKFTKLVFVLALFFLSNTLVTPVYAQGSNYEILLKQYRGTVDVYKVAYDRYLAAKAEYAKYQTLVSKTVATENTQDFMAARQKVMIAYLNVLKERVEQSPELTEEEIGPLIRYVNDEIDIMAQEMPLFDSANDLDDLVKLSHKVENRYPVLEGNAYRMKGYIITSKIRSARKTMANLLTIANEQVARIRKENLTDSSRMDRWLIEAGERLQFADINELSALEKYAKLKDKDSFSSKTKVYDQLQTDLKVAAQYLREANHFLLEIVQDIRFD